MRLPQVRRVVRGARWRCGDVRAHLLVYFYTQFLVALPCLQATQITLFCRRMRRTAPRRRRLSLVSEIHGGLTLQKCGALPPGQAEALRLVSAAERREREPKGLGKLSTSTSAGDENVWAASAPLLPAVSSELNQQLHASRREHPRQ